MFNPDLKEMLKNVNSRYSLVVGTAKRARKFRTRPLPMRSIWTPRPYPWLLTTSIPGKYVIEEPDELKQK